jgi:hypothetical protein
VSYSIDTSALLDGWVRYYPPEVFPCLWNRIDTLIDAGLLVASEEVNGEIQKKQDELAEWAKHRKMLFVPADDETQIVLTEIMATHGDLVNIKTGGSGADPWVIALARVRGLTVVSGEIWRLPKLTIPSECAAKRRPSCYDEPLVPRSQGAGRPEGLS